MDVIDPDDHKYLTKENQLYWMEYVMLLRDKHDSSIKGRGFCYGRNLQEYVTKEETISPTTVQEDLMLSWLIEATETNDIGTTDMTGAFFQTDMAITVWLQLYIIVAHILLNIYHEKYIDKVVIERGKKVIYVVLKHDMYGPLSAPSSSGET